ncbi:MAG: dUTP diphosphatase [Heyndrickxia sp.]
MMKMRKKVGSETVELENGFKCKSNWINILRREIILKITCIGKSIILEEFVDGVHFILSIGTDLEYNNRNITIPIKTTTDSLNALFLAVYNLVSRL